MEMIHDFNNSIKLGKEGEIIITDYISKLVNVLNVQEVENIKKYQDEDVDLLVTLKNGRQLKIEIKTDKYDTGNIFYETISSIEGNTIGCMEKTKADFLFYYFTKTEELYIMNMNKYRKWFNYNKSKFIKKTITNKCRDGVNFYTSEGFLIKKVFLENDFKYYKKYFVKYYKSICNKDIA